MQRGAIRGGIHSGGAMKGRFLEGSAVKELPACHQAGGTHSTVMHSCFYQIWNFWLH